MSVVSRSESGPKSGLIAVKVLSKALPALYVDVGVAMSLIGPCETSLTSNEVLSAYTALQHTNIVARVLREEGDEGLAGSE